jgi:hypothetical protein
MEKKKYKEVMIFPDTEPRKNIRNLETNDRGVG